MPQVAAGLRAEHHRGAGAVERPGRRRRTRRRAAPGGRPPGRAAGPGRCCPARPAGCRSRCASKGTGSRKPPHLETLIRPVCPARPRGRSSGRVPAVGRHLGDRVDAAEHVRPEAARSGEPGNMQAMPTMATSSGAGAWSSRRPAGRAGARSSAARRRGSRRAPVVTSSCSAATVVVGRAQHGDLAGHEHALAGLAFSSTAPSASPSRRRPLLAIRSRPTLSRSSCSHICRFGRPGAPPAAAQLGGSRRRTGVCTHRVACPGAVSSSAVLLGGRAPARWNSGWIAPCATASSVNR